MLLKELCELHGVSGNEKAVRNYILDHIAKTVDSWKIDNMGNLMAHKYSSSQNPPRVVICAHMDEVGLLVTEITGDGYLKFKPIGRIEPGILISKPLLIGKGIQGVIGLKAVHLQQAEERKQPIKLEDLYIDIGASSKEEAEAVLKLGDYGMFPTSFEQLGHDLYKAKALDDRAGCALIIKALEKSYDCQLDAVFTVQEEVGLRGSKVVSNYLQADLAIIIDTTKASDIAETDAEDWIVQLGQGPACSLMDSATIYQPELIAKVSALAKKHQIPLQFRLGTAAANDAGNIHQAGVGIPTITLSLPCRYIHSMSSVISKRDYEDCSRLIQCILDHADYLIS